MNEKKQEGDGLQVCGILKMRQMPIIALFSVWDGIRSWGHSAHTLNHRGQRKTAGILPYHSPSYTPDTGSLTEPGARHF